jgi:flavin reductase (DIM6/NTAB) family NADH-FMN oxidoreductase RutF
MKLLISPQLSVRRAAQRRILYELNSRFAWHDASHNLLVFDIEDLIYATTVSPAYQPPSTSTCRCRPFTTTPSSLSKPPQETTTESSLSHKIRLLMRRIPHPVAIVTASSPPSSPSTNTKPTPRGMTVSSFNTVTLHPSPIITFNVRQPSETLEALQSSRRFLVHLLSPTASMARLARNFSRGNENVELGRFEFIEHEIENESLILPRLSRKRNNNYEDKPEEEDFTFILECEYLPDKSVLVYDHMIVLGNVRRIIAAPRSTNALDDEGRRHTKEEFCLMYADTRFWGMGEETS